jgi:Protein phosphatase 2C.
VVSPNNKYVILASDGLWDVAEDQVINIALVLIA